MKLKQSEDGVKQNRSAFPTGLGLAVMPQFFNRLLKLKADDIHERLNDPSHLIANQVFHMLGRMIHQAHSVAMGPLPSKRAILFQPAGCAS